MSVVLVGFDVTTLDHALLMIASEGINSNRCLPICVREMSIGYKLQVFYKLCSTDNRTICFSACSTASLAYLFRICYSDASYFQLL